jgi:hypothetical protein
VEEELNSKDCSPAWNVKSIIPFLDGIDVLEYGNQDVIPISFTDNCILGSYFRLDEVWMKGCFNRRIDGMLL